jgi:hypothetical protein
MFFTYIVVEVPTLCTGNEKKEVLQVVFGVVIFKTTSDHTKRQVTLAI